MTRIKNLFNNDHVFNDTAYAGPDLPGTDGCHRQVTMITVPTAPVVLPNGTNAILYTDLDSLSVAQLYFFNGSTTVALTPLFQGPLKVTGSSSYTTNQTKTVYANPGFRWAGSGWAYVRLSSILTLYNFSALMLVTDTGDSVSTEIRTKGPAYPLFSFNASGDLQIKNPSGSTVVIDFSLIINREN